MSTNTGNATSPGSATSMRSTTGSARALIRLVLGKDRDLAREYPLVFDENARGEIISIEVEGEVRSACALLERELALPDVRVRAGFIGSVVTHPDFRGRGLASRVLARAEKTLAERGAIVAILWGDDQGFYARRGYRPFGAEVDFAISHDVASQLPEPVGVRAFDIEDAHALHDLYAAHPERVTREREETRALLGAPDMEVLVCERWGKIAGYSCLGRGRDLREVVHEWAGDAQTVTMLVRAHMEKRTARGDEGDLYVMAPPSAKDLSARLTAAGALASTGILGLAKLVDPLGAAKVCAARLDRRGGIHVRAAGEKIEFTGGRGHWEGTPSEVLELLFAARGTNELSRSVARKIEGWGSALPLTPFVWGLDSI
jgi:GNAT superfamily N-acetyltransferase